MTEQTEITVKLPLERPSNDRLVHALRETTPPDYHEPLIAAINGGDPLFDRFFTSGAESMIAVHVVLAACAERGPSFIKGQEVRLTIHVDGEQLALDPIRVSERDGNMTSTWRVADATHLARLERGAEVVIRSAIADSHGNVQPVEWVGTMAGISAAGRHDYVTVTVEGVRREWGEAEKSTPSSTGV
jgi:hypothetical protein